jgi:hypothetical protein
MVKLSLVVYDIQRSWRLSYSTIFAKYLRKLINGMVRASADRLVCFRVKNKA